MNISQLRKTIETRLISVYSSVHGFDPDRLAVVVANCVGDLVGADEVADCDMVVEGRVALATIIASYVFGVPICLDVKLCVRKIPNRLLAPLVRTFSEEGQQQRPLFQDILAIEWMYRNGLLTDDWCIRRLEGNKFEIRWVADSAMLSVAAGSIDERFTH